MDERKIKQLTEDELDVVTGGAMSINSEDPHSGGKCPVCSSQLTSNGNKYHCSQCGNSFVKTKCSICGNTKLCLEYSGGRYVCTDCSPVTSKVARAW